MLPNAVSPYIPYGSEAFNDKQKIDTEYLYDQNGSTTADVNTGISTIQYNLLNLPDQIQFTEGHKNLYTYDASGKKLEAVNYTVNNIVNVPIGTISALPASSSDYTKLTTDYVGNMIYENGSLKEILLPDGYWQNGVYYYYLKDHLGDNRVVINSSGTVVEKSHYYPSGMRFYPESTSNSAALPYRYNGKELEAMNGLNQYDFGARRRGTGLPVWTGVDPLAEKHPEVSPYVYCMGNLVNRIDLNGMDWIRNNNGNVEWRPDAKKDNVPTGYKYIGTEYMGITITKFETKKYEYEDGEKETKLLIEIGYKDPNSKKKDGYNWVQTVSRDGKKSKVDYDSKSEEGRANLPYYQPEDENKDSRNKNGFDITFHDQPSETNAQGSFNAELSLIGVTNIYKNISMMSEINIPIVTGKRVSTIFTLNYGFYGSNIMLRVLPINVVNPSIYQLHTINQIK